MIRKLEAQGVAFSAADLAVTTPQLRALARTRLADMQEVAEPAAA
ncbi:hypothetical protein [Xanthobacter autotrophicus]